MDATTGGVIAPDKERRGLRHSPSTGLRSQFPGVRTCCLDATVIQNTGAPISLWDTPPVFFHSLNIEIVMRNGGGNKPQREVYLEKVGATMRQVVIYPGEDNYWVAECPSLPGCISQGKTKEDAIANIREAIEGYVSTLQEDKLPVPREKFETILIAV